MSLTIEQLEALAEGSTAKDKNGRTQTKGTHEKRPGTCVWLDEDGYYATCVYLATLSPTLVSTPTLEGAPPGRYTDGHGDLWHVRADLWSRRFYEERWGQWWPSRPTELVTGTRHCGPFAYLGPLEDDEAGKPALKCPGCAFNVSPQGVKCLVVVGEKCIGPLVPGDTIETDEAWLALVAMGGCRVQFVSTAGELGWRGVADEGRRKPSSCGQEAGDFSHWILVSLPDSCSHDHPDERCEKCALETFETSRDGTELPDGIYWSRMSAKVLELKGSQRRWCRGDRGNTWGPRPRNFLGTASSILYLIKRLEEPAVRWVDVDDGPVPATPMGKPEPVDGETRLRRLLTPKCEPMPRYASEPIVELPEPTEHAVAAFLLPREEAWPDFEDGEECLPEESSPHDGETAADIAQISLVEGRRQHLEWFDGTIEKLQADRAVFMGKDELPPLPAVETVTPKEAGEAAKRARAKGCWGDELP